MCGTTTARGPSGAISSAQPSKSRERLELRTWNSELRTEKHEAGRAVATAAGAGGLAGDGRNLQAGRRLSLHDRERRPRRACYARRRRDARGGRVARHRKGYALPGANAKVRSMKYEV